MSNWRNPPTNQSITADKSMRMSWSIFHNQRAKIECIESASTCDSGCDAPIPDAESLPLFSNDKKASLCECPTVSPPIPLKQSNSIATKKHLRSGAEQFYLKLPRCKRAWNAAVDCDWFNPIVSIPTLLECRASSCLLLSSIISWLSHIIRLKNHNFLN